MIELLISACLVAGGGCRDFSLLYDAREMTVMTCMVQGLGEVARWQENSPGWQVERWRCALPSLVSKA